MTQGQRRLLVAAGAVIALLAVAVVVLVTVLSRSWRSVNPQLQGDVTIALGDDETMVFVAITPGRLNVPGRLGGLFRGYELEICEPYLIGATEVTEAQWAAVMGEDLPWKRNPQRPKWLAFADAERFVARLNRLVGPEFEASIPTEVQWEYACRAGSASDTLNRDAPESFDAMVWHRDNCGLTQIPPRDLPQDVRVKDGWYGDPLQPVATKLPNDWGLHDMLGNASEWCEPDVPVRDGDSGNDDQSEAMAVARGGSSSMPARSLSPRTVGSAPRDNPMFKCGIQVVLMTPIERVSLPK